MKNGSQKYTQAGQLCKLSSSFQTWTSTVVAQVVGAPICHMHLARMPCLLLRQDPVLRRHLQHFHVNTKTLVGPLGIFSFNAAQRIAALATCGPPRGAQTLQSDAEESNSPAYPELPSLWPGAWPAAAIMQSRAYSTTKMVGPLLVL